MYFSQTWKKGSAKSHYFESKIKLNVTLFSDQTCCFTTWIQVECFAYYGLLHTGWVVDLIKRYYN